MSHLQMYVLICATMAGKDLLYTLVTAFVAHGHPWLAGATDVLGDIAGILSALSTFTVVLSAGFSWASVGAILALAAGSMLGTVGGVRLAGLIERRLEKPIPHPLRSVA